MRERPLLYSAPMVRATLNDTKSQTRRGIRRIAGIGMVTEFQRSDTPGYDWSFRDQKLRWNDLTHADLLKSGPYGTVSDRLWVRETWAPDEYAGQRTFYRADDEHFMPPGGWKPSIHMPRLASRITLALTEVRVERLRDISEADAKAEGAPMRLDGGRLGEVPDAYRRGYAVLWESINGEGSWNANPWVWVLAFKRLK